MDAGGLELAGVGHAYGEQRVVADFSLTVGEGEIVCLLGPSGCGKSTVLRLVAGLEVLREGRIMLDGRLLADSGHAVPPEVRHIGMVFQDLALFPHLSIEDNVAFGLRHIAAPERRRLTAAALKQVDLGGLAGAFPHMLSGGEQQRVALARALAPRPRALLLDEPFSSLDARLRDRVRDDTLALLTASSTTALLVTHDPEEAMRLGDRIAVMNQGRLLQVDTPETIYRRPAGGFVARLFGELNEWHGTTTEGAVTTPLGPLATPGLDAGVAVEVLIRPEAVRIAPRGCGGTSTARVLSSRLLGPYSVVRLAVCGSDLRLVARVAEGVVLDPGAKVSVRLDPTQVFVFPTLGRAR